MGPKRVLGQLSEAPHCVLFTAAFLLQSFSPLPVLVLVVIAPFILFIVRFRRSKAMGAPRQNVRRKVRNGVRLPANHGEIAVEVASGTSHAGAGGLIICPHGL